ncbi:MAG: trigger factor [Clostridia bacterium]|nr:trigger factor [Clostridia bacterium]
MKKTIALVLACMLLVTAFCGCGEKESTVELGQYKGLTYTLIDTTVTEEDVQAQIDYVLSGTSQRVEDESRAGTPVQEGDFLWIDFVGTLGGVEFSGGSTNGVGTALQIGSGQMIPGFEEALIGKTVGDTVTIDVTFPAQYSNDPNLAGKNAQFEIQIHYVFNYVKPEYNDAFVADYTNGMFTTTADYEAHLMEEMTAAAEKDARNSYISEILNQGLAGCTFDISGKEFNELRDGFIGYYEEYAGLYGYDLKGYAEALGMTMEEFENAADMYAQDTICTRLFYTAVAEAEGITVTEEEFDARIDAYLVSYGYTDDLAGFEAAYGLDMVRESMLQDIVNEHLIEWSIPVEG